MVQDGHFDILKMFLCGFLLFSFREELKMNFNIMSGAEMWFIQHGKEHPSKDVPNLKLLTTGLKVSVTNLSINLFFFGGKKQHLSKGAL